MTNTTVNALILAGDGINCERETAAAASEAGFHTQIIHINDLIASKGTELQMTSLLVLPGGFSFGDELGCGKVLALKLSHGLGNGLSQYINKGGAVLGICNGFQALVRLGVFGPNVVLTQNQGGRFIDRWIGLNIIGSSIFTDGLKDQGMTHLELSVRHGEGRLVVTSELKNFQTVLQYEQPLNGSWNDIAALSAHNGHVLGMMPHPEAFWTEQLHPSGNPRGVPLGSEFFRGAYEKLRKEQT